MRRRTLRGDRHSPPTMCEHLDALVAASEPQPLTPGRCGECDHGTEHWAHLRMCLTCGHVGCCDSSPGRHATEHFQRTGHAVMRSIEPGEGWRWCYLDLRVDSRVDGASA